MADWDYTGAHRRHDMRGIIALPHGSLVEVCDWTERLPDFMREAETLIVDPPWNLGNVRSFYTKADQPHPPFDFHAFLKTFWRRVDQIAPRHLFLEIGKEALGECLVACQRRWLHTTFYNATYYKKRTNKCYIIHATDDRKRKRYAPLEDLDEADTIAWLCANHASPCIGDLCMGTGLVGKHAYLNARRFVGTELNPKRLAVMVEFIREQEAACA
jgi:hypothetical protein